MQRLWIDDPALLREQVKRWKDRPALGLDTEFVRERTFFPELGLVQIADGETCSLVDPLALDDLDPLREILVDPGVVKVVHSCSEDMEVLYHELEAFPEPIFDTQTAAALAGHDFSMGYQSLVDRFLGVELEKGATRSDWSRRPLADEQLHYAVQDALHLLPLYERLREELEEEGRLSWVFEETRRLADADRFLPSPEEAYRKLGRLDHLNRRQLAAAQSLAAWREREARRRDLPRGFVLRDKPLLELSRRLPTDTEKLRAIRDLHPRTVEREGEALLRLVEEARNRRPHRLPDPPARLPRSKEISAVFEELRDAVRDAARRLGVPAPSLASRRQVRKLLRSVHSDDAPTDAPPAPFDGWRWTVLGEAFDPILDPIR